MNSMFWSLIVFVICFEWEAITFLVKFQSSCPLEEMGVRKDQYNQKEETKIVGWHVIINIVNLVYHVATLIGIISLSDGDICKRQNLTMGMLDLWSTLTLFYLTFTLARLVYYTKRWSFDAYQAYKQKFFTRAVVLYLSILRTLWITNQA